MSPVARRGVALAVLATVLLVAGAARAAAHPLGNFTVNAYSGLRVGPDRLGVDYVVDLAEIPAFQARKAIDADRDGRVGGAEATSWRDRECPRLAGGLRATVDGRPVPLAVTGSALTFPEGVGGLATLRLECALAGPLPPGPSSVGPSPTPTPTRRAGSAGGRSPPSATAPPSTPPTSPPPAPASASPPIPPISSPPPSTSAPPPSASAPAAPRPPRPPARPHRPSTRPDRPLGGPDRPLGGQPRTRPPGARPPGGGA